MIWGILVIMLLLVANRTRFSIFSPVVLFILFFSLSIILTIPYHYLVPNNLKFSIARLDFISDEKVWQTLSVFAQMLVYFCSGVLLYKYSFNIKKNPSLQINFNIQLPNFNTNSLLGISIFLIVMDVFLVYLTYGKDFFFRWAYNPENNVLLTIIMEYSQLFLIFLGGILYKDKKIFSLIIAAFVVTLCTGFGSRMATIYLIVYIFTIFILYIRKEDKKRFVFTLAPLVLIFFGYNLSLRFNGDDGHGLIPYLLLPFNKPEIIIENTFFNIYYTLIFGVFGTFKTLSKYPEGYNYLLTSFNPLPGGMTDWYLIYKKLRINPYAPFTAIGEIFSFPYIAAVFYFFLGFYFSHSEKKIFYYLNGKKFIGAFILFLLTCAFIPYSFEYNLRSSVRFIYYSIIFMIIMKFTPKINFK